MGLRAEFASVNVITQKNVVEETSRWPRKFLARMMKVMIKIGLHMIKKESTRTRSVRKSFMSWRETWYKTESLTEGCLPRGRSLCLQFLAIWNTNKIILDNTAILYFVTLHLSLSLSLYIYIYICIYIWYEMAFVFDTSVSQTKSNQFLIAQNHFFCITLSYQCPHWWNWLCNAILTTDSATLWINVCMNNWPSTLISDREVTDIHRWYKGKCQYMCEWVIVE